MAIGNDVAKLFPRPVRSNTGERKPVRSEGASRPGSTSTESWIDVPNEPARRTVLVVDGLDSSQSDLRGLLEHDGYRVLIARQGADALEILGNSPVDLVILDMFLPDMNGAEFCRRVRGDRRT